MYEIFSGRRTQVLQRSNHQRRNIAMKGGCILKSRSYNVLKKKVLGDLGNNLMQKNEDESPKKSDHQISKQPACDKKSGEENDTGKDGHQRLFETIVAGKRISPEASREIPNYVLDTSHLSRESILFDECSNSTFGENSTVEDDVFFGIYSISEDEKELISTTNWDMDIDETMSGYCSEGGSCSGHYDERWLEEPLWNNSEDLHQIVGVPETSKCETLTKLEDMEFTSLFSEIPCPAKATLDVPDILLGNDYENDAPKYPVPELEW